MDGALSESETEAALREKSSHVCRECLDAVTVGKKNIEATWHEQRSLLVSSLAVVAVGSQIDVVMSLRRQGGRCWRERAR